MIGKQTSLFSIGQTIHHKLFGYRGVIVDVDPCFAGTEEWYEQAAQTCPPKDKPWYHVFVHGSEVETYVAERNLEADLSEDPIAHPLVSLFFTDFRDGVYVPRQSLN